MICSALRHAAGGAGNRRTARTRYVSYNEYTGEGNGFTFLNYNAHDMLHVVQRAEDMYRRHKNDVLGTCW